jgi:hypothetical protein
MSSLLYKKGVTIVEILTVVGVLLIVSLAVGVFQKDVIVLNSVMRGGLEAEREALKVVKVMANEIRRAVPGADGSYPLVSVSSTTMTFFSDVDNDPAVEKVRYYVSGGKLYKGVTNATTTPPYYTGQPETSYPMIDYLLDPSASIFAFFDSNYDGTTAPLASPIPVDRVRLVKVSIVIDRNAYHAPKAIQVETQVSIRNLKTNL